MGKLSSLLFGAAIGAGLMYYFDSNNGNRRKAMIRDHVNSIPNSAASGLEMAANDLRLRVRGLLSEGAAMMGDVDAGDDVIAERIRSRLGFLSRHPGAIQVEVHNKSAILSGDILADEVDNLMAGVKKARGVMGVENRMRVHQQPGNIPQLQGEGWLPSQQSQWSPGIRLLAGTGALYLYLYGMIKGGFIGTLAEIGGFTLGARTLVNKDLKSLVGMSQENNGDIQVRKSISIDAPVDQVWSLWSNFENFPRFMSNVESIRDLGNGRSHWTVKGPAGSKVEFDAITTEARPNEVIAWETVEDSTVKHHGQVRFKNQKDRTQVNVNMAYTPPGGVVGHTVASIFGKDPKSSMDEDLARMKTLLETGKTSAKGGKVTSDQIMQDSRRQIPQTGESQSGGKQGKKNQGQNPQNQGRQDQDQGQGGGMIPQTGSQMHGLSDMSHQHDQDRLGEDLSDDDIIIIEETTLIPTTGMSGMSPAEDFDEEMDEDLDQDEDRIEDDDKADMGDDETNSDPLRGV